MPFPTVEHQKTQNTDQNNNTDSSHACGYNCISTDFVKDVSLIDRRSDYLDTLSLSIGPIYLFPYT